jgi:hypothetical protein
MGFEVLAAVQKSVSKLAMKTEAVFNIAVYIDLTHLSLF